MRTLKPPTENTAWRFVGSIRDVLTRMGLDEVITYSFIQEDGAGLVSRIEDNAVKLRKGDFQTKDVHVVNTLSPEMSYMRSSLLPSMQATVVENAKRFSEFSVFEISRVTIPQDGKINIDEQEPYMLSISHYASSGAPTNALMHIKAIWVRLINELGCGADYEKLQPLTLDLGDTRGVAFAYEVSIWDLLAKRQPKTFTPIPVAPSAYQDVSFIVNTEHPIGEIVDAVKQKARVLLKQTEILDIYQSKELKGEGKHSLTLRLTFQDERSLADSELNPVRQGIEAMLVNDYDATIR